MSPILPPRAFTQIEWRASARPGLAVSTELEGLIDAQLNKVGFPIEGGTNVEPNWNGNFCVVNSSCGLCLRQGKRVRRQIA